LEILVKTLKAKATKNVLGFLNKNLNCKDWRFSWKTNFSQGCSFPWI